MNQFKRNISVKRTARGWYVDTKTDVCTYAQAYTNDVETKYEARQRFITYYYPEYLNDLRSKRNATN